MNATKIIFLFLLTMSLNSLAKVESGQVIKAKVFNESVFFVGDIKQSLLTESEHQSLMGNCWQLMRNQNVSQSDYGNLLKTQASNPSLVVTLPSSTNLFLRDTGAGVGQFQNQDWKSFNLHNVLQGGNSGYDHDNVYMGKSTTSYVGNIFVGQYASPAAALGVMWDTSETRPKNLGVNLFVKINDACD